MLDNSNDKLLKKYLKKNFANKVDIFLSKKNNVYGPIKEKLWGNCFSENMNFLNVPLFKEVSGVISRA